MTDYEDVDHVLRTCPRATAIWRHFASAKLGQPRPNADFSRWFWQNLSDTKHEESWPTMFLIILWYLWKWRNGVYFARYALIPSDKIRFLCAKCKEILQALCHEAQQDRSSESARQETLIHWDPPPTGWMVLNTDSASKGNPGAVGSGGVLRGDKGEWICDFRKSMGNCSAMKSEIKAILRGLWIAKDKDIKRVWVQVDSSTLVGLLKDDSTYCAEHASIIRQCRDLIHQEGWEVRISHCYREANKVADALANMGCNFTSGVAIYDFPLPEIREDLLIVLGSVGLEGCLNNKILLGL